ncbi:MAG: deoxyribose-phosphate aldolase, partial [Clostridia bacterium]|nr:deoxyribose-phosphate aldolase [Clostridia bacterium]
MKEMEKYFDHTILKPQATRQDVVKLCSEAKEYDFFAVCVNSCYVKLACDELTGTDVKVASVIGFPLGACETRAKIYETQIAVEDGAEEIDMVINIGALKERRTEYVLKDIQAVVDACKDKAIVKVIIETCLLTKEEIILACELSKQAGAHFVKTSTGFLGEGATAENV